MSTGLHISTDGEEIERLARGFDDAAGCADDALLDLRSTRQRLAVLPSVPDGSGEAAVVAIDVALSRLQGLRDRARARAVALREANRSYDAAEDGATPLHEILLPPGSPFSLPLALGFTLGGLVHDARTGAPLLPATRVAGLLSALPIHRVAGLTQVFAPHLPYLPEVARAAITLLPDRGPVAPPAAATLVDVADRVRLVDEAAGDGEAVVDIQRVEHTDGTTSWTVAVHGTKDGPLDLAQPFSVVGNKDAYLGLGSPGEQMVIAAMEEAGIPPGDPVILAAHSQGGLAMTRLATNHGFRDRFAVRGVVTFGAPVGHLPPPKDASVLHVQHVQDGVAFVSGEAGGRTGGPAPGEVFAVVDLGAGGAPPPSGMDAHDMPRYVESLQRVLDSDHPATSTLEDRLRPLLAEEGATVTATTYRGTRSPTAVVTQPFG